MLVNRTAGARGGQKRASAVSEAILQAGFEVESVEGFDALSQASEKYTAEDQLRAVVAIGGDGTVGLALNATPAGTPLLVVPAGTENLLAKYLRCGSRPSDVVKRLTDGVTVQLDAGRANGRLFALMISAGLDAEVVRRVHANRKGNITHLAYAWPILATVMSYEYPPLHASWVDALGKQQEVIGRWMFGVNLPRYAQNLPIVPEADGTDGLLNLCLFRRGGTAAGLWYLWNIVRRRRDKVESVTAVKTKAFRVSSPTAGVPYQLDGDPAGELPVEVSVEENRLTLLVSRSTASRLGFQPPER